MLWFSILIFRWVILLADTINQCFCVYPCIPMVYSHGKRNSTIRGCTNGKSNQTNVLLFIRMAIAIKPKLFLLILRWQKLYNNAFLCIAMACGIKQMFVLSIAMATAIKPMCFCYGDNKRYTTSLFFVYCDGKRYKTNVCFCSLRLQTV